MLDPQTLTVLPQLILSIDRAPEKNTNKMPYQRLHGWRKVLEQNYSCGVFEAVHLSLRGIRCCLTATGAALHLPLLRRISPCALHACVKREHGDPCDPEHGEVVVNYLCSHGAAQAWLCCRGRIFVQQVIVLYYERVLDSICRVACSCLTCAMLCACGARLTALVVLCCV